MSTSATFCVGMPVASLAAGLVCRVGLSLRLTITCMVLSTKYCSVPYQVKNAEYRRTGRTSRLLSS